MPLWNIALPETSHCHRNDDTRQFIDNSMTNAQTTNDWNEWVQTTIHGTIKQEQHCIIGLVPMASNSLYIQFRWFRTAPSGQKHKVNQTTLKILRKWLLNQEKKHDKLWNIQKSWNLNATFSTSAFVPRHGPAGDETRFLLKVLRGELRGRCAEES